MRVFISSIFFTLFLLVPELYAADSNRVVAFVNDEVITLYELNNKIEELTGKTCEELQSADEEKYFHTRDEILDMLMDEKVMKEKIKELELEADKDQVDEYIEFIKENNKLTQEALVAELEKEGVTYDVFRQKIKDDIERRSLIDSEIRSKMVITEENVNNYYESHKNEYEKPGKAHIASIFLVPDSSASNAQTEALEKKGKEILERLDKGEDFGALAREYSNGPGAQEGGDLGNITLSDVDPKILDVITSLKDGEVIIQEI